MASFYENVKQFTEESKGITLPKIPEKMTKDEIIFLIKMVRSELVELCETVTESPEEALALEQSCTGVDIHNNITIYENDIEIISDQADAIGDAIYYMNDACAKKGINISSILDVIHQANMNKRDPLTGKFIRRDDGKVIKPEGWKAPNINDEIVRQIEMGSIV